MSYTRICCTRCGIPLAWCKCAPAVFSALIREAGR